MIIRYYRADSSVILEADKQMIADINSYIGIYFNIKPVENSNLEAWHIIHAEQGDVFLQMGFQKIIVRQIFEPDITIFFDGIRKKIILLKENSNKWQIQNILRMIRVLLRLQCQEKGNVFLHGGCLSYRDKGICFLGDKKSGKTSSILSFLKYKESKFLSNDDVSFYKKDSTIYAQGWPRSIVIREDTLKELDIKNYDMLHPLNSKKVDLCLYPQQIGKLFGRKCISETPIDYIVFPRFNNEHKTMITFLDKNVAYERIKDQILKNPGKYNEYLLPYFNVDSKKNNIKEIIKNIKVLELNQCMDNLKSGTTNLASIIDGDI